MLQYLGKAALNICTSTYQREINKPWHHLVISTFICSSSLLPWLCHQTACLLRPDQKKNPKAPHFPLNSWAATETTGKFSHSWIWWVWSLTEKKKFPSWEARNPRQHNRLSHDNLFILFSPFFPPNEHFNSTFSFHPATGVCEITSGCVWKRLPGVQSQIAQGFPPPAPRRHALTSTLKLDRLACEWAETFRLLKSCIVRRSGELYRNILRSVRKASSCYTGSRGEPHNRQWEREGVH